MTYVWVCLKKYGHDLIQRASFPAINNVNASVSLRVYLRIDILELGLYDGFYRCVRTLIKAQMQSCQAVFYRDLQREEVQMFHFYF